MTYKSIEPSKDMSFRQCVPRFVKDEDVITVSLFFLFSSLVHLFSLFHFACKVMGK